MMDTMVPVSEGSQSPHWKRKLVSVQLCPTKLGMGTFQPANLEYLVCSDFLDVAVLVVA